MIIRALHTIPEFRAVIALEREIWGSMDPDDAVGVPFFVVTVKRGGILLGAYEGARLIGFVFSIAALKDGRLVQWSHMLGVRPGHRASGVGRALKLEQRRISLEMGIDLMEWTFDPLVAANAHLNVRRLGAVVDEYLIDVYGESTSPLHRGAPTDRFVAQWWMRSPRVEAALGGTGAPAGSEGWSGIPRVNAVVRSGRWLVCGGTDLSRREACLAVTVPAGYADILREEPGVALAWRMATREIFTAYLPRGYRVVDFSCAAGSDQGTYLLEAGGIGPSGER